MTEIYPYRHRVIKGGDTGLTFVYLGDERVVHYPTDGPVTYEVDQYRVSYDSGFTDIIKVSHEEHELTPDRLAWFEAIPTLEERGVTL